MKSAKWSSIRRILDVSSCVDYKATIHHFYLIEKWTYDCTDAQIPTARASPSRVSNSASNTQIVLTLLLRLRGCRNFIHDVQLQIWTLIHYSNLANFITGWSEWWNSTKQTNNPKRWFISYTLPCYCVHSSDMEREKTELCFRWLPIWFFFQPRNCNDYCIFYPPPANKEAWNASIFVLLLKDVLSLLYFFFPNREQWAAMRTPHTKYNAISRWKTMRLPLVHVKSSISFYNVESEIDAVPTPPPLCIFVLFEGTRMH